MNKPILTVFTPAFNRAHTITRTYESLKRQTLKEFVWLIIDDGSTDNTAELVNEWCINEKDFEIDYIYKPNGGMHTAHNTAYENIKTVLNVCIDSDDIMPDDAVESIIKKWNEIKDCGYAGMIGLDAYMSTKKTIGKGFPDGLFETTVSGYYDAGGSGDKKLVYRTDVINSYPEYPVFEGEKYVSLAYKYRLIDQDYKMAVLDKVLCYVDYQPDGSSNTMWRQYYLNPKGFAFWRTVRLMYPSQSKKRLFIDCIHYVADNRLAKNKHYLRKSPKKMLTLLAFPAGVALECLICYRNK